MRLFANICFTVLLLLGMGATIHAAPPAFELNNMPPPQVRLRYASENPQTGDSLQVRITVAKGWHVNANIAADEFLLPSRLETGAKGMAFGDPVWPTPIKEYSEALQIDNLVFKDSFDVSVPVSKLQGDANPTTTHVVFHYQACSNFICLAPGQVTASLSNAPPAEIQQSMDPAKKKGTSFLSVLKLLLLAFAGGLILNLMPCVLPVLSLKIFSLVRQSRESRGRILQLGLSTSAGILASFWALAAVILVIRNAGGLAGWGFQFQHTGFLVFMTVLLTLFAANLFGAFEIWLPGKAMTHLDHAARKEGPWGAFFHGGLLTLLSTPCSAPFLGTAMGFAFGESGSVLFLFFGAAALGLATPYLLISAFPQFVRWMPKPGDWMLRFKQFLGFPMLGTVIWLLWVLGQQTGPTPMAWLLVLLCAIALFGWLTGWIAPPGQPFWKFLLVWSIALALLIPLWIYHVRPSIRQGLDRTRDQSTTQTANGWEPFTPELLAQLNSEGKTVFLDFTADWCITCKANEKAVLDRDTVRTAFQELGVALLKADWTSQNPEISKILASHGRSGVPFYLIYPGGNPQQPIALPELLTVDAVLTALEKAGPSLH